MNFNDIVGMTFSSVIKNGNKSITFKEKNGDEYSMFHSQDCCESVYIEDINGDLKNLENSPILFADESTNRNDLGGQSLDDSWTWTFYRIGTIKGGVVIRWLGTSNGYYSEGVDFEKI